MISFEIRQRLHSLDYKPGVESPGELPDHLDQRGFCAIDAAVAREDLVELQGLGVVGHLSGSLGGTTA